MHVFPRSTAVCGTVLAILIAGCSSGEPGEPEPSVQTTTPAGQTPTAGGVSSGGVTTRVDAPAEATESQYGQACLAAKRWFDERGGDPRTLVEAYLKTVQEPGFVGPATFDARWAELTPGQQAGVVMAAAGAADGQCS